MGASWTLGARFPNIYDIYDTNDEDAMEFMTYCIPEG